MDEIDKNNNMKVGFAVLVGRSNVGKSTLLNTLIGTKIAATSFRAQMTRHAIHGVLNTPEGQAVFIDTPGMFKDKKNQLSAKLTNKIKDVLEEEFNVLIYVVDPTREIGDEEKGLYGMIRKIETPKILVINKSDLPRSERRFTGQYLDWKDDFADVFQLSALRNSHVQPLRDRVIDLLPEGEPIYSEQQLTNIDDYFWIGEIIREKTFSLLEKEVPYSVNVEVENVEDKGTMLVITAKILTNEDRYKRMIIGQKGRMVKEIGQTSRKELEQALNKKIYLNLEVEVDKHWVERI